MKFFREMYAEIRRLNAAEQQLRSGAYDKAPGFHWAMLGLTCMLCIMTVLVTVWLTK